MANLYICSVFDQVVPSFCYYADMLVLSFHRARAPILPVFVAADGDRMFVLFLRSLCFIKR